MNKKRRFTARQWNKLGQELLTLAIAVLGIILLVCNFFKIVPEDNLLITGFIAYGFPIGLTMVGLGIGTFLEIRNTDIKEFSKKAR